MGDKSAIKMGFVGYGRAAVQQHAKEIEGLEDKFKVVAVSVRSGDRQEAARERYHCAVYRDYRDLLRDPTVELVDITTPSVDHTPMAIAALEAGKHVFLEKPVSVNYAEAQSLQAVAERSAGKLLVRHNRRFFGDFVQVKQMIDSGRLGKVFQINLRFSRFDLRNDWQTMKAWGGGIVLNAGPHFIDQCLAFLGWKYESVWADFKRVTATGDAEDHAKIVFKGADGLLVDLEMSGSEAFDGVWLAAYGNCGAAVCDGKTIQLKYYDPQKVTPLPAHAVTADPNASFGSGITIPWVDETVPVGPPQKNIWDEVYKAIREGAEYPITVEQAVLGIKVIDDANASAGGRWQP